MLLPLPNEEGAGHFCLLLHVAMQFGLYLHLCFHGHLACSL